jgi:hypothetical protein
MQFAQGLCLREGSLPDVLGGLKRRLARCVESANDAGADDEADEQAESRPGPNLTDEALADFGIGFGAQGLLEEGEEDRDDDAGFETFSEADEEDCGAGLALVSSASTQLIICDHKSCFRFTAALCCPHKRPVMCN